MIQLSQVSKCSMMYPRSCPRRGIFGNSKTKINQYIASHKKKDNSPPQDERDNSLRPISLVLTDRSYSRSKPAAKEEIKESSQRLQE